MTVEIDKVTQAVSALRQFTSKQQKAKKKNLFEEPDNQEVYLQVSMKKIPTLQHLQYHKINLPHPFTIDMKDVCLLTGDLDQKKPDDDQTVAHFSQILKEAGLSVGQIIPYHQLRTEYKTYESRRHLARSYQTFVNDGRIAKLLPVKLGTFFVRKKKMPISVSLRAGRVKEELRRALSKTTLTLTGRGSSCGVKVGVMQQSQEELLANILAVTAHLEQELPGKWMNVSSLHLKTKMSIAIPVYISLGSANEVEMPSGQRPQEAVEGDLDTLTRSRVRVHPSGKVTLVKTKDPIGVENENVDVEKKALARQRHMKNKRRRLEEKNFIRTLKKEGRQRKKKALALKNKKEVQAPEVEIKKTPTIKSMFGFSHAGDTTKGRRHRKKPKVENLSG